MLRSRVAASRSMAAGSRVLGFGITDLCAQSACSGSPTPVVEAAHGHGGPGHRRGRHSWALELVPSDPVAGRDSDLIYFNQQRLAFHREGQAHGTTGRQAQAGGKDNGLCFRCNEFEHHGFVGVFLRHFATPCVAETTDAPHGRDVLSPARCVAPMALEAWRFGSSKNAPEPGARSRRSGPRSC